jgi:dihydrofolate reductase
MQAIVAVYADWGIGAKGTQPLVIPADRKRFRELTNGAAVIVGRKTLEDFPGGRPLKNRHNIVITRQNIEIEGAEVAHTTEEAVAAAERYDACFVIGGASVFRQFFPYLDTVHVTKIGAAPFSDSFFPDLDADPDWVCSDAEPEQEHDGVKYQFCVYKKVKQA